MPRKLVIKFITKQMKKGVNSSGVECQEFHVLLIGKSSQKWNGKKNCATFKGTLEKLNEGFQFYECYDQDEYEVLETMNTINQSIKNTEKSIVIIYISSAVKSLMESPKSYYIYHGDENEDLLSTGMILSTIKCESMSFRSQNIWFIVDTEDSEVITEFYAHNFSSKKNIWAMCSNGENFNTDVNNLFSLVKMKEEKALELFNLSNHSLDKPATLLFSKMTLQIYSSDETSYVKKSYT